MTILSGKCPVCGKHRTKDIVVDLIVGSWTKKEAEKMFLTCDKHKNTGVELKGRTKFITYRTRDIE